jgi:alpha-D-ribose 1-methylphosphonate 5-triphosphate synthase subunit PhnG
MKEQVVGAPGMGSMTGSGSAAHGAAAPDAAPAGADGFGGQRQRWMAVLARANAAAIATRLGDLPMPPHTRLRGPEIGLIMVRGRQGGDGDAFNLGEMTVARCTVRLADGRIGHATVAGRDTAQAELAAALDAALQDPDRRPALLARVIAPLAAAQAAAAATAARKAAATRVNFFTMATMR